MELALFLIVVFLVVLAFVNVRYALIGLGILILLALLGVIGGSGNPVLHL